MRPFLSVGLLLSLVMLSACDQDRMAKLEERNKQLSTRLDTLQQFISAVLHVRSGTRPVTTVPDGHSVKDGNS